MKKLVLIFTLFAAIAISLAAQSLKKTERISNEQVPVAIVRAFETDFGRVPDAGYWTANYIVEQEGTRSIAKPLSYSYHKRNKNEKIEVRYTAAGKLDFVKGLEKIENPNS
jgi:hypothetical protein